jgi:hypothetical protein
MRHDALDHVARLERDTENLRRHTANLEQERNQLRELASTIDQDRNRIRLRTESLEQLRHELEERATSLERELKEIQRSTVWRLTSFVRSLLNHSQTNGSAELQTPSTSDVIFSSLDVPGERVTTITETCFIRGWTCSPNGIESVDVFIDEHRVLRLVPDLERADVALVYPHIAGAGKSGFDATLKTESLSRGLHDLQVEIRDRAGNSCRHVRSLQVH